MISDSQEPRVRRAFHPLRVKRVVDETHDAKSFVFEVPAPLASAFRYKAGQFLTLEIHGGEAGVMRRCYSLASSPDCEDEHKVTVKRVRGGRASNWLNDHVREGDLLSVLPPDGRFVLHATEADRPLVLFGGGSGITPVISLMKTALRMTTRAITLVYANRDARSIIFQRELEALAREHEKRVRVIHRLDDADGFLTRDDVRHVLAGIAVSADVYLCGPGAFMDVVERGVLAFGVDAARLHIERFASLADPKPAEHLATPPSADAVCQTIEVGLHGVKHEVPYAPGKYILHAARDAGLDVPYSCEEGFCGSCAARLVEGQVKMDADDALSDDEKKKGLILTCQSRPTTARCSVVYVD